MGGGQKRQIFLRMDYRRVAYEGGIDAFEESTYTGPRGVLGVHHCRLLKRSPKKSMVSLRQPRPTDRRLYMLYAVLFSTYCGCQYERMCVDSIPTLPFSVSPLLLPLSV
jgi:hypothetical protein